MKKLIFLLTLLAFTFISNAQDNTTIKEPAPVDTVAKKTVPAKSVEITDETFVIAKKDLEALVIALKKELRGTDYEIFVQYTYGMYQQAAERYKAIKQKPPEKKK